MSKLFGTDGIRGTANEYPITPEIVLKCGMAVGHFFKKYKHRNRCVIAKDTRLSGYMLEPSLTAGLISMGVDVMLVGPLPTPAVPVLMKSLRADFGIMISASHNEYHDNGVKIFDRNGEKLSDDTQLSLEKLILSEQLNEHLVKAEKLGRCKRLDDAIGRYIEVVKSSFLKGKTLEKMRIVLDCANGAAYKVAPLIFWELGAEVISIASSPDGFNINKGCGSTSPELLVKNVRELRADIGIALDGDADRIMVCDEKGNILSGDHIIAVIATELQKTNMLKGDGIVTSYMSNQALEAYLNSVGLNLHRSDIGDRYVYHEMERRGINFGGEQSGHIIVKDISTTGDGILAAIYVLNYILRNKCKVSELNKLLELHPQILENISFKGKNPLEKKEVDDKLRKLKLKYKDVRFLIRKSGTEKLIRVMAEGANLSEVKSSVKEAKEIIQSA